MDQSIQEFVGFLVAAVIPFLPVLFGAVEYIKSKTSLGGGQVEALASGLFVLFGVIVVWWSWRCGSAWGRGRKGPLLEK